MSTFTKTTLQIGVCPMTDAVYRFETLDGPVRIITELFDDGSVDHRVVVDDETVWSGWQDTDDEEIDWYTGYEPLTAELDVIFQDHLAKVEDAREAL